MLFSCRPTHAATVRLRYWLPVLVVSVLSACATGTGPRTRQVRMPEIVVPARVEVVNNSKIARQAGGKVLRLTGPVLAEPARIPAVSKPSSAKPKVSGSSFLVAERYEKSGEYAKAVAYYRKILASTSNRAEVLFRLGGVYERGGDRGKALSYYSQAVQAAPQVATYSYYHGLLQLAVGNEKQAMSIWQRALERGVRSAGILSEIGKRNLERGKTTLARKYFEQALKLEPEFPDALNGIGNVFLKQGRLEQATGYWKRALESLSRSPITRDEKGYVFGGLGRSGLSEVPFEIVVGVNPGDEKGPISVGYRLLEKGEFEAALKELLTAERIYGPRPEILKGIAFCYSALGDYDTASNAWDRARKEDPTEVNAAFNFAITRLRLGDVKNSRAILSELVKSNSKSALVHAGLGEIALRAEDSRAATRYYKKALSLDPSSNQARANYALALEISGNESAALEQYARVLRKDDTLSFARFNLALLHLKRGRFQDAKTQLSRLLTQDPDDLEARVNYGYSLAELGDVDAARVEWQRVLRSDPNNSLALANVGVSYSLENQHEFAVDYYERAIASEPQRGVYYNNLAAAQVKRGKLSAAREAYLKAVQFTPADYEARRNLGQIFMIERQPARAVPHLQVVLSAVPNDKESLFQLAVAYRLLGRRKEARELYQKFLDIAEEDVDYYDEVLRAQAELRTL